MSINLTVKIFSILVLVIVTSCNSNKKEQQIIFDEVMNAHDEVMPKMDNLRSLSAQISQMADSLALDSLSDNSQKIEKARELSRNLKDANESMMQWMRQFEQVEEGTPHGEVIQYLTEQRKQIQKVRDDMLNSKKEADDYLLNSN